MSERGAGLHKGRLDFFFTLVTRLFDVCCHSTSEKDAGEPSRYFLVAWNNWYTIPNHAVVNGGGTLTRQFSFIMEHSKKSN